MSRNPEPLDKLAVYSLNCLKCSHLVEGGKREFTNCHFSKGNKFCPASEVKIIPTGRMLRYASRVRKARLDRNPEAEQRLLALVAKESTTAQAIFYDAVDNNVEVGSESAQ